MKFTEALAHVAKQNLNLKIALLSLSITTLFLGFSVVKLSLADPLVIERSCYTKDLSLSSAKATELEMTTFIELALKQRFNSDTLPIEGFLTPEELKSKKEEQGLLLEKEIQQNLIVRSISFKDEKIIVEADRLYSVKDIRSAFPTKFLVKLESKPRSHSNPYGLILTNTSEIKPLKTEGK